MTFWYSGKEQLDGRSPFVCLPENQATTIAAEAPG
jgi:hypothetical protein